MELNDCLKLMVDMNASDIFFRPGGHVHMRVNGALTRIEDSAVSVDDINRVLQELLSEELREFFKKSLDVDLAYYSGKLDHRFRVSIFMQRNWPAVVIRNIPSTIETMENLNLPADVLKKLALENRGFVLLTGTTGSGKSTTLATMIEHINSNCHKHILTIEEPIEYTFKDKNSVINQREVGRDVSSYPTALRTFTLQSPDVIYIGNIRDYETVSAALTVAESGVLVLSTLHTVNASQSVERLINFFPPHQHAEIRTQLSLLLKGVISQRLVPLKDNSGRMPACEIMILTPTISRLIREGKIWEIPQFIEDGAIFGMQSFEQALTKLVKQNKITEEEALSFSDNKDELILTLKGIKQR